MDPTSAPPNFPFDLFERNKRRQYKKKTFVIKKN